MSYSGEQFHRALLKTLDKIADELHKSNKLMDRTLKYNEKTFDITEDWNELNKTIIGMNVGLVSKDDFVKYLEEKIRNNSNFRKEDIKPDDKKEDQGYKTVRYEEVINENAPEAVLFNDIINDAVYKTHYESFDKFIIGNINRLTGWNIDVDAPDIPFLTKHVSIIAYDVIRASREVGYRVRIDGKFLFSFVEWLEHGQDLSTLEYKTKVVYKIINERKLEDVNEETDSTSEDLE